MGVNIKFILHYVNIKLIMRMISWMLINPSKFISAAYVSIRSSSCEPKITFTKITKSNISITPSALTSPSVYEN